jgi:hypothetical protein
MANEIFGIKFGDNEKVGRVKITEYHITKNELCEALGFEPKNVSFIQYDYKKGMLLIKAKGE